MPTSAKIKFGGKEFDLPPIFKLHQLRDISAISIRKRPTEPDELEKFNFDTSVEMVVVALRTDKEPMNAEEIYDLPVTSEELFTTRMTILRHTGMIVENKKPGEGVAEVKAA